MHAYLVRIPGRPPPMITVTSAPGGKAGLSNANSRAQSGSGDRTSVGEDGKVLDMNGG